MTAPPSPRLARRGIPAGPSGAARGLTRRHHQCGAGPDGRGAPPLERRRRPRAALPLFPRPTLFRIHGDCLQNPWWQRRVRNDGTARVLRQATTARSRPRRSAAQHARMRERCQVGPENGPTSAFYHSASSNVSRSKSTDASKLHKARFRPILGASEREHVPRSIRAYPQLSS